MSERLTADELTRVKLSVMTAQVGFAGEIRINRETVAGLIDEVERLGAEVEAARRQWPGLALRSVEELEAENARLRSLLAEVLRVGVPDGHGAAVVYSHGTNASYGPECACGECRRYAEQVRVTGEARAALGDG